MLSVRKRPRNFCLPAAALLMFPGLAAAYIGPGAGIANISTVVIIGGLVLLALAGLLWYPLKRLLSKKKGQRENSPDSQS